MNKTPVALNPFQKALFPLLLLLCFGLAAPALHGQASFEERKAWLLDKVRTTDPTAGEAKTAMPVVCAQLSEDPTKADALQRAATSADYNDRFFRMLGQVRAYYLAKDHFSPEQVNSLKTILTSDPNWYNTGTENHRLMVWTSGYLFAQAFPDELWNWEENGVTTQITSADLMQRLLNLMITRGQWRFSGGNSEYLSPNYDMFSIASMCNLYDLAADPVARDVADAFLHYHVGTMALGSHDGYLLAPFSRNANQGRNTLSISQWVAWLYWGDYYPTNFGAGDRYVIYLALSSWRPSPVMDAIARKEVEMPFTFRAQQPHWQRNPLRYVVRTTYRDTLYSLSTGVIRHVPGAFQLDDSQFGISYTTTDEMRFIEAMHPYWRTKSRGDDWWSGPTSPFQQSVQQENAAILLYDIPETDPWAGVGAWAGERNTTLTQRAQVRLPMAMAQKIKGANDWYFFREGTVYVAIKALAPGSTWEQFFFIPGENSNFSWVIIRSDAPRTGFIFEVGDEAEFGSFTAFQEKVQSNPLSIDWESFTVAYTNSRGDELMIRYNTSLETPDGSIPDSWINGRRIDHVNWPFMESPHLNLTGRVMTLKLGDAWKRIDWSGELPVITEGTGAVAPRILRRFVGEGATGEPMEYTLGVLNGAEDFSASGLPAGLDIDPLTGTISGTPAEFGGFDVTVTATNAAGSSSEIVRVEIADNDPFRNYFPDHAAYSQGWYFVTPLGWIRDVGFPFVYHLQHGYWYLLGEGGDVIFAYDYRMGDWLITSPAFYPYLYRLKGEDSSFIYFLEGWWSESAGGRWFFDYNPVVFNYFLVPDN